MTPKVVSLLTLSFATLSCSADSDNNPRDSSVPKTPAGWTDRTETERCGLAQDKWEDICGFSNDPETRQMFIDQCAAGYRKELTIGCGDEWDEYQACLASGGFGDCSPVEPCESENDAVLSCREAFSSRTGCVPTDQFAECSGVQPEPFDCVGEIPDGCVRDSGDLVCCASFTE